YHPRFNSPEADIILISSEETAYRVHSFTLRNTCGYFRNLFSHGQAGPVSAPTFSGSSVATMPESDAPLSQVLALLCGLSYTPSTSIDELDEALSLAERWEAPGPISIIRNCITSPIFLTEQPLRLYAVATKFGWDEEAKLASTETLTLDLYQDAYKEDLAKISPRALMKLLRLHRKRREGLKAFLDSADNFELGNLARCPCPGCETELDNHTWRELKWRMVFEMDKRALGDSLYGLDMEEWPEATACWSATCSKADCARMNYDKTHTLRKIKNCIDNLPLCI
ncbi:hypothetical protein CPB83DRAFT_742854, partial [Crepidotus variabilis]